MDKRILIFLFIITFILGACGTTPSVPVEESPAVLPAEEPETVEGPVVDVPANEEPEEPELVAANCLNGEVSPIAQSIADDYEAVSYEQIVTWFCNGAEYEDILVALETEALTDTTVEEMLQMLADGFSWDEIWQLVGLNE